MLHQVLLVSNPQLLKRLLNIWCSFYVFFKFFIDQYPIILIITLNITITVHMSIQYSKILKETINSTLHVIFFFPTRMFPQKLFENIFVILHCTHVMIIILIIMSDEMNSEIEFFFACHDFWYQHLIDIFCLQAYLKSPINYNGKTV